MYTCICDIAQVIRFLADYETSGLFINGKISHKQCAYKNEDQPVSNPCLESVSLCRIYLGSRIKTGEEAISISSKWKGKCHSVH